jgi:hypothetical protein
MTGLMVSWGPDEDPDKVFVVEYVINRTPVLWTTTALNPDDAAGKFRRVNAMDPINRVLFDTGWHRATEQEEYVPPTQEPVTEQPIPPSDSPDWDRHDTYPDD